MNNVSPRDRAMGANIDEEISESNEDTSDVDIRALMKEYLLIPPDKEPKKIAS